MAGFKILTDCITDETLANYHCAANLACALEAFAICNTIQVIMNVHMPKNVFTGKNGEELEWAFHF